jgi:hypothetical protein
MNFKTLLLKIVLLQVQRMERMVLCWNNKYRVLSPEILFFLFWWLFPRKSGSIVTNCGLDDRGSFPDGGTGFFF